MGYGYGVKEESTNLKVIFLWDEKTSLIRVLCVVFESLQWLDCFTGKPI
jgi:hypothetical protein